MSTRERKDYIARSRRDSGRDFLMDCCCRRMTKSSAPEASCLVPEGSCQNETNGTQVSKELQVPLCLSLPQRALTHQTSTTVYCRHFFKSNAMQPPNLVFIVTNVYVTFKNTLNTIPTEKLLLYAPKQKKKQGGRGRDKAESNVFLDKTVYIKEVQLEFFIKHLRTE